LWAGRELDVAHFGPLLGQSYFGPLPTHFSSLPAHFRAIPRVDAGVTLTV
jgi:hypothetical protein